MGGEGEGGLSHHFSPHSQRNCVFATFASHEDAKRVGGLSLSPTTPPTHTSYLQGLGRLHQLCVLQSRLVVEYVQDKHSLQDTRQDTRQDTTEEDDGDDDDGSLNEKSPTSSAGSVSSYSPHTCNSVRVQ